MSDYTTTVTLDGMRIEHVEEVEGILAALGNVALYLRDRAAVITTDVGGAGGFEDLWDLKEVCAEVEANLGGYIYHAHIPKPVEVKG